MKDLRMPAQDIRHAYEQAANLIPDENRFKDALARMAPQQ